MGDGSTHILIDAGVSRKRILEGLAAADLSLEDLDAILITHEHTDHIGNLGVLLRTRDIPVYGTKGTLDGILSCRQLGAFDLLPIVIICINVGNIAQKEGQQSIPKRQTEGGMTWIH